MKWLLIVSIGLLTASSACSRGPAPAIVVASPESGATVSSTPALSTDGELAVGVDVAFSVHDFTLKKPGSCDGASRCGHVQIHVDGDACNDEEAEGRLAYNEIAYASPASANLIYCKAVTIGVDGVKGLDGDHILSLGLYGDDETAVKDGAGNAIHTDVHFTLHVAQPAGAGGGGAG